MGRYFNIALEYDGENPIRNTFLCDVDDLNYSDLTTIRTDKSFPCNIRHAPKMRGMS